VRPALARGLLGPAPAAARDAGLDPRELERWTAEERTGRALEADAAAAIANLAPDLPRRPRPSSVRELLDWAAMPLATAEVALVMGTGRDAARRALAAQAQEHPAGADAYWTCSA